MAARRGFQDQISPYGAETHAAAQRGGDCNTVTAAKNAARSILSGNPSRSLSIFKTRGAFGILACRVPSVSLPPRPAEQEEVFFFSRHKRQRGSERQSIEGVGASELELVIMTQTAGKSHQLPAINLTVFTKPQAGSVLGGQPTGHLVFH